MLLCAFCSLSPVAFLSSLSFFSPSLTFPVSSFPHTFLPDLHCLPLPIQTVARYVGLLTTARARLHGYHSAWHRTNRMGRVDARLLATCACSLVVENAQILSAFSCPTTMLPQVIDSTCRGCVKQVFCLILVQTNVSLLIV